MEKIEKLKKDYEDGVISYATYWEEMLNIISNENAQR